MDNLILVDLGGFEEIDEEEESEEEEGEGEEEMEEDEIEAFLSSIEMV